LSVPVDCEPLTERAPDHEPLAVQPVAFAAAHAIVALEPLVMELGFTLRLTDGAGVLTETVADCIALPPGPSQLNT
jgi:hypothetical protein